MYVERICIQCYALHANDGELNHPMCDDCVRDLIAQLELEDELDH
jgi:hypothetical protein